MGRIVELLKALQKCQLALFYTIKLNDIFVPLKTIIGISQFPCYESLRWCFAKGISSFHCVSPNISAIQAFQLKQTVQGCPWLKSYLYEIMLILARN